ncbi:class II heat shock protein [Panicum miliaceum]|uniref:Class II heat shock protein n=1 Tax=Panicum miliaceum TaxID=4540 RepID=A0A3L6SWY5_PANMI|nr:class II heat shock protein [Panicum miliaceum]
MNAQQQRARENQQISRHSQSSIKSQQRRARERGRKEATTELFDTAVTSLLHLPEVLDRLVATDSDRRSGGHLGVHHHGHTRVHGLGGSDGALVDIVESPQREEEEEEGATMGEAAPPVPDDDDFLAWGRSVADCEARLVVSALRGLSSSDAAARLRKTEKSRGRRFRVGTAAGRREEDGVGLYLLLHGIGRWVSLLGAISPLPPRFGGTPMSTLACTNFILQKIQEIEVLMMKYLYLKELMMMIRA